jgi:tetratricopeptide (TPR) repeat protein
MKHIRAIRGIGVLSILVITACKSTSPDYYARYSDDIQARLLAADSVFYSKQFRQAEKAYREILEQEPKCVDARVGLGRSLRYSGKLEEAAAEFKKAYEADKSSARTNLYYGKSLVPWWGMAPKDEVEGELVKAGIKHMERALRKDPWLIDAHLFLWTTYIYTGEPDKAAEQMKALIDKEFFPKPILDFGYNLLVGADRNAVIFTNGDMDTYPLLALQYSEGFRSDVRVVNVNLLNLIWYVKHVRDELGVPISYSDEVLKTMEPRIVEGELVLIADVLIDDILTNAEVPVYFAMLPESRINQHTDNASREGLLVKAEREPVEKAFNREKAVENVEKLYRIDLPEEKIVWSSNTSPLTREPEGLFVNYGVICEAIADDYIDEGEEDKAIPYLRKAADIFKRYEEPAKLAIVVDTWLKAKPDDPEALELKKSLE